jgi:hypothetical protein
MAESAAVSHVLLQEDDKDVARATGEDTTNALCQFRRLSKDCWDDNRAVRRREDWRGRDGEGLVGEVGVAADDEAGPSEQVAENEEGEQNKRPEVRAAVRCVIRTSTQLAAPPSHDCEQVVVKWLRCPGWLLECEVRCVALGSDVQKTLPESFLLQELGVFKRVLKRVLKKVLEDVDARETRAVGCQKELSGCVEVVHYIMLRRAVWANNRDKDTTPSRIVKEVV